MRGRGRVRIGGACEAEEEEKREGAPMFDGVKR